MIEISEDRIKKILTLQEGDYLHRLPKEGFITSAYGITNRHNPNAPIFRFYRYIIRDCLRIYKVNPSRYKREHIDMINEYIKENGLKEYEWRLVYQTVKDKYIDTRLFKHSRNEKLSYAIFAIDYNSGRGVKVLQMVLNHYGAGLRVDNMLGKHTIGALQAISKKVMEDEVIRACQNFYAQLTEDAYRKSHLRICKLIKEY